LDIIWVVLIVGPKWCGKTTTAEQYDNNVLGLQDPDKRKLYFN
jgi:predicted AAA+ superfamily ATPase